MSKWSMRTDRQAVLVSNNSIYYTVTYGKRAYKTTWLSCTEFYGFISMKTSENNS